RSVRSAGNPTPSARSAKSAGKTLQRFPDYHPEWIFDVIGPAFQNLPGSRPPHFFKIGRDHRNPVQSYFFDGILIIGYDAHVPYRLKIQLLGFFDQTDQIFFHQRDVNLPSLEIMFSDITDDLVVHSI